MTWLALLVLLVLAFVIYLMVGRGPWQGGRGLPRDRDGRGCSRFHSRVGRPAYSRNPTSSNSSSSPHSLARFLCTRPHPSILIPRLPLQAAAAVLAVVHSAVAYRLVRQLKMSYAANAQMAQMVEARQPAAGLVVGGVAGWRGEGRGRGRTCAWCACPCGSGEWLGSLDGPWLARALVSVHDTTASPPPVPPLSLLIRRASPTHPACRRAW